MDYQVLNKQVASELYFLIIFQFVNEENEKWRSEKKQTTDYMEFINFDSASIFEFQREALKKFGKKEGGQVSAVSRAVFNNLGGKFNSFVQDLSALETIVVSKKDIEIYVSYISSRIFPSIAQNKSGLVKLQKENKINGEEKDFYNSDEVIDSFIEFLEQTKKPVQNWDIDKSQYKFQNTCYWLYYYDEVSNEPEDEDEDEDEDETDSKQIGISKALVLFKDFGQVSIINYNVKIEKHETYIGTYEIWNQKYLYMELNVFPNFDRDLSCMIYIGTERPVDIAVGQFHNVDIEEKIYSGTLVIKKIWDELSEIREKVKSKEIYSDIRFYSQTEETTPKDLTVYIKSFLSNKNLNFISVPNKDIQNDRSLTILYKEEKSVSKKK